MHPPAKLGIETGVDLDRPMDAVGLPERLLSHPSNARIRRYLLAGPVAGG